MAFVMVLSYSRQIFLRFFLDARMENFLRGHVAAFTAWNGVPRVLLSDYVPRHVMKSVFSLAARRTSVSGLAPRLGSAPVS
jgi:transposase